MDNQFVRNTIENFQHKERVSGNKFYWFLDEQRIDAPNSLIELSESPTTGKLTWDMYGWTGTPEEADISLYSVAIAYIDENPIDAVYTTRESNLDCSHMYSTGDGEATFIDAEDATLTLKLDPVSGIAIGNFDATFIKNGSTLRPKVKFHLKRIVP